MSYLDYLHTYFYTKEQLLKLSRVGEDTFLLWQQRKVMPQAAYRLKINLESESFFGQHNEAAMVEYYAKGYLSWLAALQALFDINQAYLLFKKKYLMQIKTLQLRGFDLAALGRVEDQDERIAEAWQHFIAGTYGVCTKSGLPEDVASKAIGTAIVNSYLNIGQLDVNAETKLFAAVDLLDEVVAEFAPHERKLSSRHKYIDEVNKTRGRGRLGWRSVTQQ